MYEIKLSGNIITIGDVEFELDAKQLKNFKTMQGRSEYDRVDWLEEALRSLLGDEPVDLEIIAAIETLYGEPEGTEVLLFGETYLLDERLSDILATWLDLA
jgi:hypothetical protein